MNLLNLSQQKRLDRKYHETNDKDAIIELIDKFLVRSRVRINEFPTEIDAKIEVLPSGKCVHLSLNQLLPPGFEIWNRITIYAVSNRYIEIMLEKDFFDGKDGIFDLVKAKIAHNFRQELRIPIDAENDDVKAENFQLSQYFIGRNMIQVPPIVKEVFSSLNLRSKKDLQGCEIFEYNPKEILKEIQAVQKTLKPLYLENIHKGLTTKPPNSDFLDYKLLLGTHYKKEMELISKKRIKSLVVIPIIYTNLLNERVLIGCFRMSSQTGSIASTIFSRLYKMADGLSIKIKEMNSIKIKTAQKITNISNSGIQIKVLDENLAKKIAANPEEVVLDINPDTQFRFTFMGKVMNMFNLDDGTFAAGIRFTGSNSTLFDILDWHKYVDNFRKTRVYDENLIIKNR